MDQTLEQIKAESRKKYMKKLNEHKQAVNTNIERLKELEAQENKLLQKIEKNLANS